MLRPYQQAAFDAATDWMSKTIDPFVIDAATGAGKSHIIAVIAEWVMQRADDARVLCLAPSAELVEQDHEKFLQTGHPASILSASVGQKCLKHRVVFGTPQTVKNNIKKLGSSFVCVIIDEAHRTTPTVREVIAILRERRPYLRVCGLSASPYNTGKGYIYALDVDGKPVDAIDPYYMRCVYRIEAWDLIRQGYLTPPTVGGNEAESYDTSGLVMDRTGSFTAESVDRAFVGKGRLTSEIVADVVRQSANRMGVIFFCANVAHAQETLESLPPELSALVTGDTKKHERKRIVRMFKARELKYLVNVAVFTTGFDAPHVDVIAVLCRTESPVKLQQIIGRGTRLHPNKRDFLVLDYAGNIEAHFPQGDIFKPEIKTNKPSGGNGIIHAVCPMCSHDNEFSARPNPDGLRINHSGYFVDLDGEQLEMPAHFGRRCQNYIIMADYKHQQCGYRWTTKQCGECGQDNDITARSCESCKAELIDPNEKLKLDYAKRKADPHNRQTDAVLSMSAKFGYSMNGNPRIELQAQTPQHLVRYYISSATMSRGLNKAYRDFVSVALGEGDWDMEQVAKAINVMSTPPVKTITYEKVFGKPFYQVYGYNGAADECP